MAAQEQPANRGYIASTLAGFLRAIQALARGSRPGPGPGPGRRTAGAPSARPELAPTAAQPPGSHPHGALAGMAEALDRTVLAPAPPGAREMLAAAHEEMAHADHAQRDPFRRAAISTRS